LRKELNSLSKEKKWGKKARQKCKSTTWTAKNVPSLKINSLLPTYDIEGISFFTVLVVYMR